MIKWEVVGRGGNSEKLGKGFKKLGKSWKK